MDISLILLFLLLGTFTGFAAGLLGIGGGMLMVPFITMLLTARDFPRELIVHMAIATSLSTIMFTSLSSVRAHHKRGAVLWPVVKVLAPGILIGSWIGPWIGTKLNSFGLSLFFAIFVGFSATQMLMDKKPAASRELPQAPGMFGAGTVIGVLSGLVGAGGAFVSIPFMTWCNIPIRQAVATSAAIGFPVALANALGYVVSGWNAPHNLDWSFGYIWLPGLVVIGLCTMVTAPMGARLAHKMPVHKLKRGFALLLFLLASYMLYRGLHS